MTENDIDPIFLKAYDPASLGKFVEAVRRLSDEEAARYIRRFNLVDPFIALCIQELREAPPCTEALPNQDKYFSSVREMLSSSSPMIIIDSIPGTPITGEVSVKGVTIVPPPVTGEYPTGWGVINEALQGGISKGEITLVSGSSGKSSSLLPALKHLDMPAEATSVTGDLPAKNKPWYQKFNKRR